MRRPVLTIPHARPGRERELCKDSLVTTETLSREGQREISSPPMLCSVGYHRLGLAYERENLHNGEDHEEELACLIVVVVTSFKGHDGLSVGALLNFLEEESFAVVATPGLDEEVRSMGVLLEISVGKSLRHDKPDCPVLKDVRTGKDRGVHLSLFVRRREYACTVVFRKVRLEILHQCAPFYGKSNTPCLHRYSIIPSHSPKRHRLVYGLPAGLHRRQGEMLLYKRGQFDIISLYFFS